MALLDVGGSWASCSATESGFVRVSSNPAILPVTISPAAAREVIASLKSAGEHTFLVDDVSMVDDDVPALTGHRQVADAHLLVLARRRGLRLVTFDGGIAVTGRRSRRRASGTLVKRVPTRLAAAAAESLWGPGWHSRCASAKDQSPAFGGSPT